MYFLSNLFLIYQKSLLSEVEEETTTTRPELFSPGSPSVDGKEGTGMQISAIMETKLHGEPADLLITVLFPSFILTIRNQFKNKVLNLVLKILLRTLRLLKKSLIVVQLKTYGVMLGMNSKNFQSSKRFNILLNIHSLYYVRCLHHQFKMMFGINIGYSVLHLVLLSSLLSLLEVSHFFFFLSLVDLSDTIGSKFPVWVLFLILSIIFLLTNIFCTQFEEPPKGFYMVV